MKNILLILLLVLPLHQTWATNPPSAVRTIKDLRGFPSDAFSHKLNRPLYRSIAISPVEAWVVARAAVFGNQTSHAKIIHSEANGAYDAMLLEMANNYTVTGGEHTESRAANDSLTLHLLVFNIKDGKMAICIPYSDDARYLGFQQTGDAWIGILREGKWTKVSRDSRR